MPRPAFEDLIDRSAEFELTGEAGSEVLALAASVTNDVAAGAQAATDLATHEGLANPHGTSAADVGADAAGTAATAVSTHESTYDHVAFATRLTAGNQTIYIAGTTGNDATGTGAIGAPVQTLPGAVALTAAFRGIYTITWMIVEAGTYEACAIPPSVTLIQADDATRVTDLSFTSLGGTTATSIVTSGLTAEAYRGYTLTQTSSGKRRTIKGTTTTAIEPCYTFGTASSGQAFTISHAGVVISQPTGTSYDEWDFITGERVELRGVALSGYFQLRASLTRMIGCEILDSSSGVIVCPPCNLVLGVAVDYATEDEGWGLANFGGEFFMQEAGALAYGYLVDSSTHSHTGGLIDVYGGYIAAIASLGNTRVVLRSGCYLGDAATSGIAAVVGGLYGGGELWLQCSVRGTNASGPLVKASGNGVIRTSASASGANAGGGGTILLEAGGRLLMDGALGLGGAEINAVKIDGTDYVRSTFTGTAAAGRVPGAGGSLAVRIT
jgi:hypothetical protein